ncbi:acid protease [Bimuria novae-zelandiae CBS 107.79]|uniref:Acid protease n=1 Tax=Bimuria novae-zelandiae CBS 107.79 TaxID=1447943 RepID=A0A6A5USD8_9PLEO|nr:acid protease [Bimuria novae-zelandiae CBS 107.79]
MGAVTIGNSKEEYHLLLDSAASNTWVMGQECESEACGRHNTFGEGDSDTLKTDSKTFSITYGTGSVSGTTATDTIHIGSLSTSLTFGLATNVSQEFNAYPMDGILGLGKGEQASTLGTPQLIDTLFSSKLISSKLYGLHLSRAADGLNDGELTLGSVNEDRYSGDISWYPALDNDAGFWELAISDAGTDASMTGLTGKSAIIDTGTSFVFLPEDDADALHALIDGAQRDGETFSVPCSTTTFLQIKFGEQVYGVDPKDWVGGTTEEGCRSNIFARQTFGDDQWLLGDVFLKNVYAAFDLEKNRVGFGTNSGGDDGSSSSSSTSSSSSASASASATATGTSSTSTLHFLCHSGVLIYLYRLREFNFDTDTGTGV